MAKTPKRYKRINKLFGNDWNNPPTIEELQADLQMAYNGNSEHLVKVNEWVRNLHIQTIPDKYGKGKSAVESKLIRKTNEWRYSALAESFLSTPDLVQIRPVSADDFEIATQDKLVINTQINTQLNKVNFIDTMIRKCADEGTAIVRTGWDYEEREVQTADVTIEIQPTRDSHHIKELAGLMFANASELKEKNPNLLKAMYKSISTGIPHYPIEVDIEFRQEVQPVVNQPSWDVCDIRNVFPDPTCGGNKDKMRFLVHTYASCKADLTSQGIYKNLDKVNWKDSDDLTYYTAPNDWQSNGYEFKDEARKQIIVYEYWGYWDTSGKGYLSPVVITWVGDTIIRMDNNPYPDGKIPFEFVPFMPIPNSLYGEPDAELLIENQQLQGAITRGVIDSMAKASAGQRGVMKGMLDSTNMGRFLSGLDYEFNPGDITPANAIYDHQFKDLPASVYNLLGQLGNEAESLTGVKAYSTGISGDALGKTAQGGTNALNSAAQRELGIIRRLANGLNQITSKMIAMNHEFLSSDEVTRITNTRYVHPKIGAPLGYDLSVTVSSEDSDTQQAQELAFMIQTTGQILGPDFTKMVIAQIADLRKMPYLAQQIRDFEPQPNPMQEEQAKLQMQSAKADILETMSKVFKNAADARETASETQLNQMEYEETTSGIKHARDVDKITAQSKAQGFLSVVQAASGALANSIVQGQNTDITSEPDNN